MRLDEYLTKNNYFKSRNKAKESIERGEVYLSGKPILKPSFNMDVISERPEIIKKASEFASVGGFKLEKSLNEFAFCVKDLICADFGSSTGGFTDCLLQNGAKKVYAIDLNDSLLDEKIKKDERVFPVIKNAREITKTDFNEDLDFICADLSFISSSYVLSVFRELISDGKSVILLIKPQFELNERIRLKNGIVSDEKLRLNVLKNVYANAIENCLYPQKITTAPIKKGKNTEYLILLKKNVNLNLSYDDLLKNLRQYS